MTENLDVVIIGGGQAGLSVSYFLTEQGCKHVVLEKDQIGASWKKRWDSFHMVTPNWMLQLPGFPYQGDNPEGFLTREETVNHLESYVKQFNPRVEHLAVTAVRMDPDNLGYTVETKETTFHTKNVVVATGAYQMKKIPAEISDQIDKTVSQIHSSEYRNPNELRPGNVLVVGTGQSGCQIAKELNEAGRKVFLSVGSCGRLPRRYRGIDGTWWATKLGIYDRTVDQLGSPREKYACNPHVSGHNQGEDINLRQFAVDGITLLGRLDEAHGMTVNLRPDLSDNLAKADAFADRIMNGVDHYVTMNGMNLPDDEKRIQYEALKTNKIPTITELDLIEAGITTIIWATGYTPDFSWIKLPIFDDDGYPVHDRGITAYQGLYFIGLPWLHKAKSATLYGVGEDAEYISEDILGHLKDV